VTAFDEHVQRVEVEVAEDVVRRCFAHGIPEPAKRQLLSSSLVADPAVRVWPQQLRRRQFVRLCLQPPEGSSEAPDTPRRALNARDQRLAW
jgi:hypothetical protein